MPAARGVAAVVFGVLTLLWPQLTVLALAWVFGAYALVDGAMLMHAAWRHRQERRPAAAWAVAGVLGVVAGLVTALWPGLTALVLVGMAGAWAIVTGCMEVWIATRMRHELPHAGWWRASAVVSVAARVLLWLRPDAGLAISTSDPEADAAWLRQAVDRSRGPESYVTELDAPVREGAGRRVRKAATTAAESWGIGPLTYRQGVCDGLGGRLWVIKAFPGDLRAPGPTPTASTRRIRAGKPRAKRGPEAFPARRHGKRTVLRTGRPAG